VLFVPPLRRNLISSSLLNITDFEVNQEVRKIVILCNGIFIGKGYHSGGPFVLNVASDTINENASTSTYIVKSVNLWHGRLRHVNYALINKLRNVRLISNINTENRSKFDICVEAKFAKKPFKFITTRKTELLELVRSDLAYFKNTMSKEERNGVSPLQMTILSIPKFTSLSLKMWLRKCS